ncbi:MAG: hypothetical protein ACFE8O_10020 [Candidatus Hermodarchaeota archaeon]
METLSEEAEVQAALLNYLLMVKEFYSNLYTPDIVTKMEALLPVDELKKSSEPVAVRLARAEKFWLNKLFACLSAIERIMNTIDRWRDWFFKLLRNMDFDEENLQKLSKGREIIFEELRKRKMDEGYIRLVINNATTDFIELISDTRKLLKELVELEDFITSLKSTELELVEQRLNRMKEVQYFDLLNQMQQLLAATYNAPTNDDLLRNLATLLDMFNEWRRMLQMDDPALDDPKTMRLFIKEIRAKINLMNELKQSFKGFVDARSLADYYIRQAELSTIRMMLSYGGDAEKWWVTYLEAKPEDIAGFIPEPLDPHQLLIGVTHSLALLEDLDQRMLPQMPSIKTTVHRLGEFLQSPTIRLYEEITEHRLGFWDKYQPQWNNLLVKLRGRLHAQLKKANH